METLPTIRRPRRQAHTKRQLAMIAWMHHNMPPGLSHAERGFLSQKLCHWLSEAEQQQVEAFIDDPTALTRALRRRGRKPLS
jgi:hypothetical protein